MQKKSVKWIIRILVIVATLLVLCFLSRIVMEVVDTQYRMNAIGNVQAFVFPLSEYQKERGEFPQVSTMAELQEILEIHDFPFKKSNPPLHEIQYNSTVTQERPYLCYWESDERWGVFQFLLPKYHRHAVLLMWEDFSVVTSYEELDEFIKSYRKYRIWLEENRYKKK